MRVGKEFAREANVAEAPSLPREDVSDQGGREVQIPLRAVVGAKAESLGLIGVINPKQTDDPMVTVVRINIRAPTRMLSTGMGCPPLCGVQ